MRRNNGRTRGGNRDQGGFYPLDSKKKQQAVDLQSQLIQNTENYGGHKTKIKKKSNNTIIVEISREVEGNKDDQRNGILQLW